MPLGYLNLVLHAHLPYVRHPEYEDCLEEDWLFEAISETYIPLLACFDGWERDGIPWRLSLSLSPTLLAMWADPLLQSRYARYVENLIVLCEREAERTRWEPAFRQMAEMYLSRYRKCRRLWDSWGGDLAGRVRRWQQAGRLELLTTSATHAVLPLLGHDMSRRWQVRLGREEFTQAFGAAPDGFWLPECGLDSATADVLQAENVRYTLLDGHGVMHAEPRPRYGVFAPVVSKRTGLVVAARDAESSRQVWSGLEGYPGDYAYREFYRDVGFDLDFDYIKPHLHSVGVRHYTGLKYYRITGATGQPKLPYDRLIAADRVQDHAENFLFNREKQAEWLSAVMDGRPALFVAPYDAELFGHWWYEGVDWIDALFRLIEQRHETVEPVTMTDYLREHSTLQVCEPSQSSWGENGYFEAWVNPKNDWMYPPLHALEERFWDAALAGPCSNFLAQAAREMLLAQSSDWAFIIRHGTAANYAESRYRDHVLAANRLIDDHHDIASADEPFLAERLRRFPIFPDIRRSLEKVIADSAELPQQKN